LIVSAVSFQSIATVADVHELFKSETKYSENERSQLAEKTSDVTVKQFFLETVDCDNCCQCFGCQNCQNCHVNILLPTGVKIAFLDGSHSLLKSSQSIQSFYSFRLLRPPKAYN
jgi:hypothetical protein